MDHLSEKDLRNDIKQALSVFDVVIPRSGWTNSYHDDVIRVLKELGAVAGFETEVALYHPERDDVFKIPRLDTNDFPPRSERYLVSDK